MIDLARLRERFEGEVFSTASAGYDAVRVAANPRFDDVRPRLVLRCRAAADVVSALSFARDNDVHIVPRGGGHCFAGRSSTDGIVLDLAELDDIDVAADGLVTIGAGARLAQVYAELHRHGRTIPAGCGATVGIAGLTLGGGIGLLGRVHGLTCDRLVAATVVLADGRVINCGPDREPELFWALRGAGGGQFGVVTSLVFATIPEPMTIPFEARWSEAHIADVIEVWQHWAPGAPDELTANLAVTKEPGCPAEAVLSGASLLSRSATTDQLDEFRARTGTNPAITVGDPLPYHRLKQTLAEYDQQEPGLRIRSEFFAEPMRPQTIQALTSAIADGTRESRRLGFTAMGGAYNRVAPDATGFAHRDQRFLVEHLAAAGSAWIDESWAIAHTDGSGRVYPNFPDPALGDWATAYHADNFPRLVAAKHRYDPGGLFTFPQSVPANGSVLPTPKHP